MREYVKVVQYHLGFSMFFMDRALHEREARWGDCGAVLNHGEEDWKLLQLVYADEAVST